MAKFKLKVYTSNKIFFEDECESIVIPASDGLMGIMAGHENMVVAIVPGEIHIKMGEGEWLTGVVSSGFAEIADDEVAILVVTAEHPEDIDVRRAEEALERAKEKLLHQQSKREFLQSQAAIGRAMNRLKASSHGKWNI